jgi:hypothetical protein
VEAEGVVLPPLPTFLGQSSAGDRHVDQQLVLAIGLALMSQRGTDGDRGAQGRR